MDKWTPVTTRELQRLPTMGVGGTMARALGAGRRAWGSGGQGDNSGDDMDDGDSSDEDDDGNFVFHRSLIFPYAVVLLALFTYYNSYW